MSGGPQISSHEPDCGAVCPVHGTDHRDAGGWVQVHTPLHPAMAEPFRGRSCVTKAEYIIWRRSRS